MANDIKSSEECLKAVNILFEELKNAKRSLMSSESCVVNRNLMQAQLEYLRDNLPETVKKAAEIVQEEATIRSEPNRKEKKFSRMRLLRHRIWSMKRLRMPSRLWTRQTVKQTNLSTALHRRRLPEWKLLPPKQTV